MSAKPALSNFDFVMIGESEVMFTYASVSTPVNFKPTISITIV
jgi:hypothetical protein